MLNPKNNYIPWSVDKKIFPSNSSLKVKMEFLLRYAVLAPSSLNTQPWKFKLTSNSIIILADLSKQLRVVDPTRRDFYISIGCAITNITEAAKWFSLETTLNIFNSDRFDKCAEVFIKQSNQQPDEESLIDYIPRRFSDKGSYNKKGLSKKFHLALNNITNNYCSILLISDSNTKSKIIELVVESDKNIMSKHKFRKEISGWLKPNFTHSKFGMPGFTMGLNLFQSVVAPFVIKGLGSFAQIQSRKDKALLLSSPSFGVILTKNENKKSWLESGIIYEKLSLLATKESIRINPLSAIIEYSISNNSLKKLLKTNLFPTMFFRMGYSNNSEIHTPRASFREVSIWK